MVTLATNLNAWLFLRNLSFENLGSRVQASMFFIDSQALRTDAEGEPMRHDR